MTKALRMAMLSRNEKENEKMDIKLQKDEVRTAVNNGDTRKNKQMIYYDACAEELLKAQTFEQVLEFFERVNRGESFCDYPSRKGLSYERLEKIMHHARSLMVKTDTINSVVLDASYAEILKTVHSENRITAESYDKTVKELINTEDWQSLALVQLLWEGFNYIDLDKLDDFTLDNIDTNNNIIFWGKGRTLDVSDVLVSYLLKASAQNYVWLPCKGTIRKCQLFGKEQNSVFKFYRSQNDKVLDPKRKYLNRLKNVINVAPQYLFISGLFFRINEKLENLGTNVYEMLDTQCLMDDNIFNVYNDEYKRSHIKVLRRDTYFYIFK